MKAEKAISRRVFLCWAGTSALAVTVALGAWNIAKAGVKKVQKVVVRPVKESDRNNGKLQAFCRRARFTSAADAIRATASRGVELEVYRES